MSVCSASNAKVLESILQELDKLSHNGGCNIISTGGLASHPRGPSLIQTQSLWHLWWTKWQWGQFFLQVLLCFPCRLVSDQLIVNELVEKFLAWMITVFTESRHWTLVRISSVQFTPSYRISLRFILILSFRLRLDVPVHFSFEVFQTNFLCILRFSYACYMFCPPHTER